MRADALTPWLILWFGYDGSTTGAQPIKGGVDVLNVDPQTEVIVAGGTGSDADGRATSFHRHESWLTFRRKLVGLREPERLVEAASRREVPRADDRERLCTHARYVRVLEAPGLLAHGVSFIRARPIRALRWIDLPVEGIRAALTDELPKQSARSCTDTAVASSVARESLVAAQIADVELPREGILHHDPAHRQPSPCS